MRRNPDLIEVQVKPNSPTRFMFAAHKLVELACNQYAAHKASDPHLAADFIDPETPADLIEDTIRLISESQEALQRLTFIPGLATVDTVTRAVREIDRSVRETGEPFRLGLIPLHELLANYMQQDMRRDSAWRVTFRQLCRYQTYLWLEDLTLNPDRFMIFAEQTLPGMRTRLAWHISATVRGLANYLRAGEAGTPYEQEGYDPDGNW